MSDREGRQTQGQTLALREELAQGLARALDDDEGDEGLEAEALLGDAAAARATDIHLDPQSGGYRLRFRIDGAIQDVATLDQPDGQRLVNQFRALARLDPITSFRPEGGRFSYTLDDVSLDLRVTEVPCIAGDKLAMRLLAPARLLQDIGQLGLSDEQLDYLTNWLETVGGMLLVSGPTGSGKTTTLYSLLHHLRLAASHVVTLEDPVEYEIDGINQMPVNFERGLDFAAGAQAMLRLDPDYLVIGELTESESAKAAVSAATGGRASMSTLHSRDAVDTVTVLRNFGLDDYEVAANLELVVAQRLVRRLCQHCRAQQAPTEKDRRWLQSLALAVPDQVWVAKGCEQCRGLGYHGRVGIFEFWRPSDEDYGMIIDHQDSQTLRHRLAEKGHRFLLDDGLSKAEAGIINLGDLRRLGTLGASSAAPQPPWMGE